VYATDLMLGWYFKHLLFAWSLLWTTLLVWIFVAIRHAARGTSGFETVPDIQRGIQSRPHDHRWLVGLLFLPVLLLAFHSHSTYFLFGAAMWSSAVVLSYTALRCQQGLPRRIMIGYTVGLLALVTILDLSFDAYRLAGYSAIDPTWTVFLFLAVMLGSRLYKGLTKA
jgi:hypothetical protein